MKRRKTYKKKWHDMHARKIQISMSKGKKRYTNNRNQENQEVTGEYNLIDKLVRKGFVKKVKCGNREKVVAPSRFTFYGDIDNSLDFMKRIVYYVTKKNLKQIYINHSSIQTISLSASLILDLILMNVDVYVKNIRRKRSLDISGEVPKNTDVGILLHANGVLPHLGFKVKKDPNVLSLDMLYGDSEISNTTNPASDILKYFSECLKMQGCSLTKSGKGAFGKMLGEVLDNCQNHSGKNGRWYALGFYHNKENRGICHIAIVTIGDTIYESLTQKGNATEETLAGLHKMTEKHKHAFDDMWDEEALWTWLSLQHGVSRLRDSNIPERANRGVGTVDMMQHFQEIGKTIDDYKPIFTMISGKVVVEFDFEKYPVQQSVVNGEERRLVTFNPENSIDSRPDLENVYKISNYFPGVIYTMEFCIDPEFLEMSNQKYVRRSI